MYDEMEELLAVEMVRAFLVELVLHGGAVEVLGDLRERNGGWRGHKALL